MRKTLAFIAGPVLLYEVLHRGIGIDVIENFPLSTLLRAMHRGDWEDAKACLATLVYMQADRMHKHDDRPIAAQMELCGSFRLLSHGRRVITRLKPHGDPRQDCMLVNVSIDDGAHDVLLRQLLMRIHGPVGVDFRENDGLPADFETLVQPNGHSREQVHEILFPRLTA